MLTPAGSVTAPDVNPISYHPKYRKNPVPWYRIKEKGLFDFFLKFSSCTPFQRGGDKLTTKGDSIGRRRDATDPDIGERCRRPESNPDRRPNRTKVQPVMRRGHHHTHTASMGSRLYSVRIPIQREIGNPWNHVPPAKNGWKAMFLY